MDTWAASAAGAYALTENNLYTVEAFADYLRHLAPGGVISFTRWFSSPPVESLRVVSLAIEALRGQGIDDPSRSVVVVRTDPDQTFMPSLGAILVKPSSFEGGEVARLRAWATKMRFVVEYAPDAAAPLEPPPNDFGRLVSAGSSAFVAAYPHDISPVHDDRPFFFSSTPLLPWLAARIGLSASPIGAQALGLGAQTLLISLTTTAAVTAAILLLPLLAQRKLRERGGSVSRARSLAWALYFGGLGLGFILVEIVLVQRLGLFLGRPAYSLSVVLFAILLSSSVGSLVSARWTSAGSLSRIAGALCAAIVAYSVALPRVLDSTLGAPTYVRVLLSVVAIAPLGFLMGMPFPCGIRRAASESSALVSWAWAVNGGASVFGSTLTVLVSMTYGFTVSFLGGAAAYLLALVMAVVTGGPQRTPVAARASLGEGPISPEGAS